MRVNSGASKSGTKNRRDLPDRQVKILCYGDSDTWGFSPVNGFRLPEDVRWPGVLRRCLGAFGMEGNPLNGSEHLLTLLSAYEPFDLLILYLGINDLFVDAHISSTVLAEELEAVIDKLRGDRELLSVLVMAPLPVNVGREHDLCKPS